MASVETELTEVLAEARWVRTAPRKAQLIVSEIRGRSVAEAQTMLRFMTRAAARDVEKVLKSAVANAEANHGLSADDLYVSAAFVGSGPTLKRWRARARGRVGRIHKRSCHITVRVALTEAARIAPRPPAPAEAPGRRTRRPAAETAEPTLAPAAAEEAPVEATPGEEPPAEKPKRPRRTQAAAAEADPAQAAPAAEAAEAKPKRARHALRLLVALGCGPFGRLRA